MRYQVSHRTTYRYADAVALSHNLAHLAPRDSDRQQVQGFELRITPKPGMSERLRDAFGNRTDVFTIYDQSTLAPTGEVVLPGGKRFSGLPQVHSVQVIGDDRFALSFNFNPGSSVWVVDLEKRAIATEVS